MKGIDSNAVKTDETGSISWEFDVKEEGLYNVDLSIFR